MILLLIYSTNLMERYNKIDKQLGVQLHQLKKGKKNVVKNQQTSKKWVFRGVRNSVILVWRQNRVQRVDGKYFSVMTSIIQLLFCLFFYWIEIVEFGTKIVNCKI
eukprot:TRINITY_DN34505_c1_g3_i1.p4 TRINITY_DN34505_c1_g3~~TRINITY_DN34505_c1_g3_i1.p4  ORF type:complete len:105 (-),score=0.92 TRINITY_DN34505_c1_g3_i1:43-357(-)